MALEISVDRPPASRLRSSRLLLSTRTFRTNPRRRCKRTPPSRPVLARVATPLSIHRRVSTAKACAKLHATSCVRANARQRPLFFCRQRRRPSYPFPCTNSKSVPTRPSTDGRHGIRSRIPTNVSAASTMHTEMTRRDSSSITKYSMSLSLHRKASSALASAVTNDPTPARRRGTHQKTHLALSARIVRLICSLHAYTSRNGFPCE